MKVIKLSASQNQSQKIFCEKVDIEFYSGFTDEELWDKLPSEKIDRLSDGARSASFYTEVKCCWDDNNIYIRFFCEDDQILADYNNRGDPVYDQEVVEVFIAPDTFNSYFEINLSPKNVLFEAKVINDLEGEKFKSDESWQCKGIETEVNKVKPEHIHVTNFGSWLAYIKIPFEDLNKSSPAPGDFWGINLYRIKRVPRQEFICWQPVNKYPPFFHVPKCFGFIIFANKNDI